MPRWLRNTGMAAFLLFLLAYAYTPVVRTGLVGEDFAVLARTGGVVQADPAEAGVPNVSETMGIMGPGEERPVRSLTGVSLALADRVLRGDGVWQSRAVIFLRLEALVFLLVGAWGMGRLVRRSLEPWTGRDQARAAGIATAVFVTLHPLALSAVASLAAHGALLAFALAGLSGAAFIKGRQERSLPFTVLAGALAILAGFTSELAFFLPAVLCLVEYLSGRRSRTLSVRLRTASTTFVVFASAVLVETIIRLSVGLPLESPALGGTLAALGEEGGPSAGLALFGQKLGLLLLPVNAHALGMVGFAIAAAAWLVAIQPALMAARAAPRLWGWFHGGWFVGVALALAPVLFVRVAPDELGRRPALFAAAVVMCAGLGVTSTALSGLSRSLTPALVAFGFALIVHGDARPWILAAEELEELRVDLERARDAEPTCGVFLVLEERESIAGLDLLRSAVPWLLHPSFTPASPATGVTPDVRALSARAFEVLAHEPVFTTLRDRQVAVVFPEELLAEHAPADARESLGSPQESGRTILTLPMTEPGTGPELWRAQGRSPVLDLDPLSTRALRVEAHTGTDTSGPPVLAWRATSEAVEQGTLEGVWLAGEHGPVAWFHLGGAFRWLLGQRTRRVWFPEQLVTMVTAELEPTLPGFEEEPVFERDERGDWTLPVRPRPRRVPLEPDAGVQRLSLCLLDLGTLAFAEFPASRDPVPSFAGSRDWLEREDRSRSIAWSLRLELDGTPIGRAAGRLSDLPAFHLSSSAGDDR